MMSNHIPVFRQPLENRQSSFNRVYSTEFSCFVFQADLATKLVDFEREFLDVVHSTPAVSMHRHAAAAAVVFSSRDASAVHGSPSIHVHLRRDRHACFRIINRRKGLSDCYEHNLSFSMLL